MSPEILDNRFEVGRFLGTGSVGEVSQARDLQTGALVALKINVDSRLRHRLMREIQVLEKLTHPNIMPLIPSSGGQGDPPYYAMELMWESLESRKQNGSIPAAEALEWALGILRGIIHASLEGVTHRDIKPGNIYRALDGRIVLGDFSSALASWLPRLTPVGHVVLGTPPYVAPELLLGNAAAGPCTEVFSVGCLLHEVLTGSAPWDSLDEEVLAQEMATRPPRGSVDRATVPDWVAHAVSRAIAFDPAQRYPSPADLLCALDRGLLTPRVEILTPAVPELVAQPDERPATAAHDFPIAESVKSPMRERAGRLAVALAVAGRGSSRAVVRPLRAGWEYVGATAATVFRPSPRWWAAIATGMLVSLMLAATVSDRLQELTGGSSSNPFAAFNGPLNSLFGSANSGSASPPAQEPPSQHKTNSANPERSSGGSKNSHPATGLYTAKVPSQSHSGVGFSECPCRGSSGATGQGEKHAGRNYNSQRESEAGEDEANETSQESSPATETPAPVESRPSSVPAASSNSVSISSAGGITVTEINGTRTVGAPPGAEVKECAGGVTVSTPTSSVTTGSGC